MSAAVDYNVDILIFGSAGLPADWVYNGKCLAGEFTANTFGVTAIRGNGKTILVDSGSNMADQLVVINTPDGPFVDVGDVATRETHILGMGDTWPAYTWQSGSAGPEYQTMMAYKKIMELADAVTKRVIMRHDLTYTQTKTPEAVDGNAVRYKLR